MCVIKFYLCIKWYHINKYVGKTENLISNPILSAKFTWTTFLKIRVRHGGWHPRWVTRLEI